MSFNGITTVGAGLPVVSTAPGASAGAAVGAPRGRTIRGSVRVTIMMRSASAYPRSKVRCCRMFDPARTAPQQPMDRLTTVIAEKSGLLRSERHAVRSQCPIMGSASCCRAKGEVRADGGRSENVERHGESHEADDDQAR